MKKKTHIRIALLTCFLAGQSHNITSQTHNETKKNRSQQRNDAFFTEFISILTNGYIATNSGKKEDERLSALSRMVHSIIQIFRLVKKNNRSIQEEKEMLLRALQEIINNPQMTQELDRLLNNEKFMRSLELHSEQEETD